MPSLLRSLWKVIGFFFILFFFLTFSFSDDDKEYARRRFKAWNHLIVQHKSDVTSQKLKAVNDFFNLFHYESDIDYKGEADYWKSPDEFVQDGGGDCEDFAIAKYFTLLDLGIPMNQLQITYVKALSLNQAHMILAFYEKPDSDPLILDNLNTDIKPATERADLQPVYSFNGAGLWLSKQRTNKLVGTSSRLGKWRELIEKMQQKNNHNPM
jgi:predicted transglutaminase-like cysteine proteinase